MIEDALLKGEKEILDKSLIGLIEIFYKGSMGYTHYSKNKEFIWK